MTAGGASPGREFPGAPLAVLLGSGLGGVADAFGRRGEIRFEQIRGVTAPRVAGHAGFVRHGVVGPAGCLFMIGRRHYYEGCLDELAALIGFLRDAGVRRLLVTSAAGSLTRAIAPGEIVLVDDIVDLQFRPRGRPAPPAMLPGRSALSTAFSTAVSRAAARAGVPLSRGTLCSMAGPTYETRSEVHFLQGVGADVASMSVAPEAAIAASFGIHVACLAVVTNWATGISRSALRHGDVLEIGRESAPTLSRIVALLAGDAADGSV